MYVGRNGIMDMSGETNYIFSERNITKPKSKLFGDSKYKKQIIERDGNIYTIWDRNMKKHYFLWICYKTEELTFKLKKLKNIKK